MAAKQDLVIGLEGRLAQAKQLTGAYEIRLEALCMHQLHHQLPFRYSPHASNLDAITYSIPAHLWVSATRPPAMGPEVHDFEGQNKLVKLAMSAKVGSTCHSRCRL